MTGIIGLANEILSQYGLLGVFVIVTIWLVVKNVYQAEKRENVFLKLIDKFNESIKDNTTSLKELSATNELSHKYQKEEHEKLIKLLTEGEKQSAINLKAVEGIEKAVGRINGFKE